MDEIEETDKVPSRNPKGAGILSAFELAPVLRVEQNSEAIAAEIAGKKAFYVACSCPFIQLREL